MMHKSLIATIAALAVTTAFAGTAEDVEKRLKDQYPATKITKVRESRVNGIYEVIMGRNVAYTDESGRYMIFGHLFDMKEQKDLTAGVLEALNKVDTSKLPKEDAIKKVQGKGERTLFVFSDPDCPCCKRLEAELAKV
ncbi:MAG: DsbC family protein, partial [Rectinema sp.]|nr:DsbC family protein [Rectinema sp.]